MAQTAREFMGERAIQALRRPALDEARGLPASLYTSREFFDIEQRRLFPRTWVGIAFDTDVPASGDAIPLTVCGLPLILVRDHGGEVRVLHNVCRHRATIVLERAAKGLRTFKCPYHGWVYGTDGSLKATPFWDGTADSHRCPVEAAGNGLVPVRSGIWNHVVFVNLDGQAEPLDSYLAPMTAELDHLDIPGLELGHRIDWKFKANWKLVMENWEVYHHVWVHEGVFDKMSDEVDLATGELYTDMIADGNVMMLRYKKTRPPAAPRPANVPALPPVPVRYEKTGPTGAANAVLPNTTGHHRPGRLCTGDLRADRSRPHRSAHGVVLRTRRRHRHAIRGEPQGGSGSMARTHSVVRGPAGDPIAGPSMHGAAAGGARLPGCRRRQVLGDLGGQRALLPGLARNADRRLTCLTPRNPLPSAAAADSSHTERNRARRSTR